MIRKNRKSPLAIVLILVAFVTAARFLPQPVPLSEETFSITNSDNGTILEHGLIEPGMTSADLVRFRRINARNILPPTDRDKASALLAECETLWNELQQFKDDPEFRQIRFSPGSRFAQWRVRAEALHRDRPGKEIVGSDINRLTDAMLGVANDYASSRNHYPSQEEWFVNYHLPMAKHSLDEPSKISSNPLKFVPCP